MKLPEYSPYVLVIIVVVGLLISHSNFNSIMILILCGAAAVGYAISNSVIIAVFFAVAAFCLTAAYINYREGFNTHTPASGIISTLREMKSNNVEGFNTHTNASEISSTVRQLKQNNTGTDGFLGSVFQNITKAGYNNPGFGMAGPLVEGFEDEKKVDKKVNESKPAPVKNHELASPFKLGEIPSQVNNGPHIDAGSTLMKAIQGLNPDQINAMTKDTKQLIETQKSLMGMLGTMKPMMQDGKELMDTFQQMFGEK